MTVNIDDNYGELDSSRITSSGIITKRVIWVVVLIAILVFAGLVTGAIFLLNTDAATAAKVRDVFIIFMAFESIIIGAALVILTIQLAILINLIQNEIKPILDTTNETISTIRGTANFLSSNLVEPVIKLNEYVAALRKIVSFFHLPWRG